MIKNSMMYHAQYILYHVTRINIQANTIAYSYQYGKLLTQYTKQLNTNK